MIVLLLERTLAAGTATTAAANLADFEVDECVHSLPDRWNNARVNDDNLSSGDARTTPICDGVTVHL